MQQEGHLSVQRIFGGQFILQFVIEVVDVGGLSLGSQVAFLQSCDSFLQILSLNKHK